MTTSYLKTIEQRLLWLSHWMIHNANHIRPKVDGIKVGGHQASSASMVSIMTALYFSALRPEDLVFAFNEGGKGTGINLTKLLAVADRIAALPGGVTGSHLRLVPRKRAA